MFSQNQGNQQAPLLDPATGIERLKEYLQRLDGVTRDTSIADLKKLVSEYYAPGSKTMWCFSTYEYAGPGLYYTRTTCCGLCDSQSGKGLEAIFDILPRVIKTKFESGIVKERFYVDEYKYGNTPSGELALLFPNTIISSEYEAFSIGHEGTLNIMFRRDLKISSWKFCARKHKEYLPRTLVITQLDILVEAANKCNPMMPIEEYKRFYEIYGSACDQLAKNMKLPVVKGLGYPEQFLRCLQIADIVDSMKDLMDFSFDTRTGPIDGFL